MICKSVAMTILLIIWIYSQLSHHILTLALSLVNSTAIYLVLKMNDIIEHKDLTIQFLIT